MDAEYLKPAGPMSVASATTRTGVGAGSMLASCRLQLENKLTAATRVTVKLGGFLIRRAFMVRPFLSPFQIRLWRSRIQQKPVGVGCSHSRMRNVAEGHPFGGQNPAPMHSSRRAIFPARR